MSKLFLFIANIINIVHLLMIIFILACPFTSINMTIDILYLVFIPFLVLHWVLNNDDCALTVMENYFRGYPLFNKDVNSNYMYRLVHPIFNLPILLNNNFIYLVIVILYIIKVVNFCNNLKNNYYS